MNTYYCVTSKWDDHGKGTAAITDRVSASKKPQDSFRSTARADVYLDWYETYEDAVRAVEAVREA